MASMLVATKSRTPLEPHHAVHRARLVDALEFSIPQHKLISISAPAGYGKTTLISQWANSSRLPVVWLSIDDEDNDLERFLRYLLTGWKEAQPGIAESPLELLLGGMTPDIQAVLTAFINVGNDLPDQTVFVLDDYHLIDEPRIHEAVTFLLDHLPPTIHFVLSSRDEPPLPMARYRARDELLEIGTDDLQFRAEETAEFLKYRMELEVASEDVVSLQSQLEGWVAGLQLAALSLQSRKNLTDGFTISGRHRFIADYLSEDVLAQQPEDVRKFLLRTSILNRLSGPLCNAVTEHEGGQEMLEALELKNLFLVPLDNSREWYRYHRLFRDFLRQELSRNHPHEVVYLHQRAARWYFARDLHEPAFHHAREGDDLELVGRIFERYGNMLLNSGELRLVTEWLDSLPESWYSAHPLLGLFRAGLLAYSGAFEACISNINEIEQQLQHHGVDDLSWQLALVNAVRCFLACIQNDTEQAELLAEQSLRDLREESLSFRAGIHQALGDTYRRNGRWDDARTCYLEALRVPSAPGSHAQSAHVFGALADLDLRQGRLHSAARHWNSALQSIQEPESWGRVPLPATGWVFTRMGELAYEWNELTEASDYVSRGLERTELGGDVRARIAGHLIAGRLRLTERDFDAAVEHLEQARPLVEEARFSDWLSRFERFQIDLWLAQDRLRAAVGWADEMLDGDVLLKRPDSEVAQLALARVLIVMGDPPAVDRALRILARLIIEAEEDGRSGILIEAQALQSLAQWSRGEIAGAMATLERTLRLAEPEGYVRLFADLGLPMARLLQEARSRGVMPDYVATLLAAFDGDYSTESSRTAALLDPLTEREQEILELIAAGLTNAEIGSQLFISPQTVRKHAGNIYSKLHVHSRTEAAARARDLDLLN